ncbi:hypothetical protein C2845_PM14G14660 [Panicum miliaceum]|uniref:F-box/LRR-repeat protein n=1 Tax=Panicum miliaceum TaxID=4540 RepID=A0A3L6PTM1_PANMI|nr:hypothetical protein C2845_PM14G14660 [Panicum miliaceum]
MTGTWMTNLQTLLSKANFLEIFYSLRSLSTDSSQISLDLPLPLFIFSACFRTPLTGVLGDLHWTYPNHLNQYWQIVARSPGLEDLDLINCAQHLELVDSKVLKRLTVDGFLGRDKGLTIACPCLIHFKCTHLPLEEISWRERPSLKSAHIVARSTFDGQPDFTGIFLHAKRLGLFGSDMKVMLEKELATCSVSESLVTLAIGEWCLTDNLYVVLNFLQLSPRLEKLTLKHRKLNRATEGAETEPISIIGMTFQCPLLETVMIQCSKDDVEIQKTVDALVATGISLEKIHVTFYEDIQKNLAERKRARQERKTRRSILEKKSKKKQDWVDDSHAISDNDDDGDMMEETLGYEYDPNDF